MKRLMRRPVLGVLLGIASAIAQTDVMGQQSLTLSIVPVGTNTIVGSQHLTIEVFITNAGSQDQMIAGTQVDLPCSLPPQVGSSGYVTTGASDPDPISLVSVNLVGSEAGIPFLFAGGGLGPTNQVFCRAAASPSTGIPATLPAGSTRYLATAVYVGYDCPEGVFDVSFEGSSDPPVFGDGTKILFPDGPDPDTLGEPVAFSALNVALTALPLHYGDIVTDGYIDVGDVACMMAGYSDVGVCPQADIFPCGGDGSIELADLLSILDAFAGTYACPHPCP